MTRPVDYPLTTPFGNVPGYVNPIDGSNFHEGCDYACPVGTPLKAPLTSTVTFVGTQSGYGKFIEVRGANGHYYLFAHLSSQNALVGQAVSEGQVIGATGNTGASTGAHLHVTEATSKVNNKLQGLVNFEANFSSGGGSMETMSDDTARQVGWSYLGRNGKDGRPNALATGAPDLVGRPLSNNEFGNIFLSQEGRNWRDVEFPKVYAERDTLRSTNATLTAQVATLNVQLEAANSHITALTVELQAQSAKINELSTENASLKATNAELQDTVDKQVQEIEQLKIQLSECDGGDSSLVIFNINVFNFFRLIAKKNK